MTLSNAFLTDGGTPLASANGDFGLSDGEVTILARVPEPSTLLLLASALCGMEALRRRRRR